MKVKIGSKTFEVSKEAMESNPEEITIDFEGTIRTKDEDLSYVENHKKDARKEGIEVAVKKYREQYGFEGRSIDKLIEAVTSKTLEEAKIEPDEKLKKLTKKLEEKEAALNTALSNSEAVKNDFKKYKNNSRIDALIDESIPENTILPKSDMRLIVKNKLTFDVDENDNVLALDSNGNVLKNPSTADPLGAKDVVSKFFKDNTSYLKGVEGGSGAGDSGGGSSKISIDEFMEQQKEKGNSPNSEAFNKALEEGTKAGTIEID